MKLQASLISLVLLSAIGGIHTAAAVERLPLINAVGACQGALPSYEGSIRKRPTAISNEGTSTAFVSCSAYHDFVNTPIPEDFGLLLTNNTANSVTMNCTLVAGFRFIGETPPTLFPKTFTIPASSSLSSGWNTDDNGGQPFASPPTSVSCALPAGVELNAIFTHVDDGSAPAESAP